ncbi:hypothetical protein MXD58_026785, partial [Frankia sp. AgKG'84/4]|nr:hypothetical protein [Frankia sp. AgKG'84/4]
MAVTLAAAAGIRSHVAGPAVGAEAVASTTGKAASPRHPPVVPAPASRQVSPTPSPSPSATTPASSPSTGAPGV